MSERNSELAGSGPGGPEAIGEPERVGSRPRRVLVAEDDPRIRALLTRFLEGEGYRVLSGSNGRAALEVARAQGDDIDVVVTDVEMPGLRGPQLVRELRATRPGLPAVFITGDLGVGLEEIVSSGPAELLVKPVSPSALKRAVRKMTRASPLLPEEERDDA